MNRLAHSPNLPFAIEVGFGANGLAHSPNLPYSKGVGSLAAAIRFLKVV